MIKTTFLTNNDCYKAGRWLPKVEGLMIHSVGCAFSSAQGFVDSWNKPNFDACVHAFIDSNTGDVYQCLPWQMRGWHAGGSANNTHIGVEMCESEFIEYVGKTSQFTVKPGGLAKAQAQLTLAYYSAVELFANLCEQFTLDPLKPGVILSHREGNRLGIAASHVDPEHIWSGLNLPFTMDGFRKDVYDRMANCPFEDVPHGAYYEKAVTWCHEHGIVKGVTEHKFAPDDKMTRAEMATVIYRLYNLLHG